MSFALLIYFQYTGKPMQKLNCVMQQKKLYALTRSVSRSFYLTLRLLPAAVRDSACVAYLLARISDTLADTPTVELAQRTIWLQQFATLCRLPVNLTDPSLADLAAACAPHQTNIAEQHLMSELTFCLTCLTQLPTMEQQRIQAVLQPILRGQQFDLQRFTQGETAPLTASELEGYTYQVAGCVGEYLSTLFADNLKGWSDQSLEQMRQWGMHYGCGLQLINMVRDLAVDQQHGRYYLNSAAIKPALQQAQAYLQDGWRYVTHLQSKRLRWVCLLPLLIGLQTLIQWLQTDSTMDTTVVRIGRSRVYAILGLSGVGAMRLAWIQPYYTQLQHQLSQALLDRFGDPSNYDAPTKFV
ncbi:MAG: hypothetical protein GKR77_02745 [Legionellales bacterium]|nr:hypothetical protein [Legionellales bacterium]